MNRNALTASVHIVLAALILLAPAAFNRSPFIFYDTAHYVQLGESVLGEAHIHVPGLAPADPHADDPAGAAAPAAPAGTVKPVHHNMSLTYVGGRSPFYSIPLAIAVGLIGFWGVAFLQALLGAWLGWSAAGVLARKQQDPLGIFYTLMVTLTALSSLPYFSSFTMPDIFAGYAIVAALLLGCCSSLSNRRKLGLAVTMVFSMMAHASNPPLIVLVLFGTVWYFRRIGFGWRAVGRQMRWPFAAFAVALLGGPLFSISCYLLLHDVPRSPPYLMARIIADGPGRHFLAEKCVEPYPYAVCAYRHTELTDNNDILWSTDPKSGVFTFADYDTRVLFSKQEPKFLLSVFEYDPAGVIQAAAWNATRQLFKLRIGREIGAARKSWDTLVAQVVPAERAAVTGSRSYLGTMPFAAIDTALIAAAFTGLLFLLFRATRPDILAVVRVRGPMPAEDRVRLAFFFLTVGLIVLMLSNAALCGITSGPTNRYQGRLMWLVLALAIAVWQRLGSGSLASQKLSSKSELIPNDA